ncbi:unnamed protein product [Ectocarpus sp. CCAP 1310/34]|nr:unnamed protein product [Ectocarpus sp. CCAP 1310/34]
MPTAPTDVLGAVLEHRKRERGSDGVETEGARGESVREWVKEREWCGVVLQKGGARRPEGAEAAFTPDVGHFRHLSFVNSTSTPQVPLQRQYQQQATGASDRQSCNSSSWSRRSRRERQQQEHQDNVTRRGGGAPSATSSRSNDGDDEREDGAIAVTVKTDVKTEAKMQELREPPEPLKMKKRARLMKMETEEKAGDPPIGLLGVGGQRIRRA